MKKNKKHSLAAFDMTDAFQLGNFSSEGWYNAYAALNLISDWNKDPKTVFPILERLLLAAAKDPCWLEFLISSVENIQDGLQSK